MARVHEHIQQAKELAFIDSSSSFEDCNNPMFVISTSSAAGGLPLGIVITSGESANIVHRAMTVLTALFPEGTFYGQGSPENVISDDLAAEKDGFKEYGLIPNYSYVYFISYGACGDGYLVLTIKYIKMKGSI